jgi:hypothetical protein
MSASAFITSIITFIVMIIQTIITSLFQFITYVVKTTFDVALRTAVKTITRLIMTIFAIFVLLVLISWSSRQPY